MAGVLLLYGALIVLIRRPPVFYAKASAIGDRARNLKGI
jgi:hypothetical protein